MGHLVPTIACHLTKRSRFLGSFSLCSCAYSFFGCAASLQASIFLQLLSLSTQLHVWLKLLRQAAELRCTHTPRPPPHPDPRLIRRINSATKRSFCFTLQLLGSLPVCVSLLHLSGVAPFAFLTVLTWVSLFGSSYIFWRWLVLAYDGMWWLLDRYSNGARHVNFYLSTNQCGRTRLRLKHYPSLPILWSFYLHRGLWFFAFALRWFLQFQMLLFPWRILAFDMLLSLPGPERSLILVFPLLALKFLASRRWQQYFSYGCSLPSRT